MTESLKTVEVNFSDGGSQVFNNVTGLSCSCPGFLTLSFTNGDYVYVGITNVLFVYVKEATDDNDKSGESSV